MSERIAILGAGKMGEALLSGLLRAGRSPDDLLIAERYEQRRADLEKSYGVQAAGAAEAAARAGTLVVAVKPQEINALLDELADSVTPANLVITIAAGIRRVALCTPHLARP